MDVGRALPAFTIVGLPDATVKEARERVPAALRNSGFQFPSGRITVNLAPAEWRKGGAALDLLGAIALLSLSAWRPRGCNRPSRSVYSFMGCV